MKRPSNIAIPITGKRKPGVVTCAAIPGQAAMCTIGWATSRHSEKVTAFLESYEGLLQSDAYDAYIRFAAENEGVILVGCIAHARRKFFEAQDQHLRETALVLKLIARLYQVEKVIRETPVALKDVSSYRKKYAGNTPAVQTRIGYPTTQNAAPKPAGQSL